MNQYIILADETIIENAWCLMAGERLIIYLEAAHTLPELVGIFGDAEKTAQIRANRYGDETVYQGYSHLTGLSEETEGSFYTVSMRRA